MEAARALLIVLLVAARADGVGDLGLLGVDVTVDLRGAHDLRAEVTREALGMVRLGGNVQEVAVDVLVALGAHLELRLTVQAAWHTVVVHKRSLQDHGHKEEEEMQQLR